MSPSRPTWATSPDPEDVVVSDASIDPTRCFIERLSPEVILYIFALGQVGSDPTREPTWELLVSWVCRRWRTIALECSSLWTTINFLEGYPYLKSQAYIERSRDAPLKVFFGTVTEELTYRKSKYYSEIGDLGFSVPMWHSVTIQKALSVVVPHVNRWEEFICDQTCPVHMNYILNELQYCPSADRLKILLIRLFAHLDIPAIASQATQGYFLFGGNTPNVREIVLRGVFLDWDHDHFQNVSKISMMHEDDVSPLHCPDLLHILRKCSQVSSISFSSFIFKDYARASHMEPIRLHTLSHLSIGCIDLSEAQSLFSLLSVPNLASLKLRMVKHATDCSNLIDSLCDPHPLTRAPILERIQQFTFSGIHTLNLAVIERAYRTMRHLRSLSLEFTGRSDCDTLMLQALTRPYNDSELGGSGSASSELLCPCLEVLSVTNAHGLATLRQLVQHRIEMGRPLKQMRLSLPLETSMEENPVDNQDDEDWLQANVEQLSWFPAH